MRKRDELTNPTSCMSKARDDEWTFVLLGRDAAAPAAVQAWINERIRLGKNAPDDPQIREAEQWIKNVKDEQPSAAREACNQIWKETIGKQLGSAFIKEPERVHIKLPPIGS